MNYPKELKYSKSHEWVKFIDEKTAWIGISDFAQDELGGIVFANLPEVGDMVTVGTPFAELESVKAVSDVYAPVTGTVVEVHEKLLDTLELINTNPYDAWLIKVEGITETEDLLDAEAYEEFIENEA